LAGRQNEEADDADLLQNRATPKGNGTAGNERQQATWYAEACLIPESRGRQFLRDSLCAARLVALQGFEPWFDG
jgi:hypothetical protein